MSELNDTLQYTPTITPLDSYKLVVSRIKTIADVRSVFEDMQMTYRSIPDVQPSKPELWDKIDG